MILGADASVTAAGVAGFAAIVGALLVYLRGVRADERTNDLAERTREFATFQEGVTFLREDNNQLRQLLKECQLRDVDKVEQIRALEDRVDDLERQLRRTRRSE